MIDPESFQRINFLRFPLIIGVIFIHAYETSINFSGGVIGTSQNGFITEFVRNLISQGFARTAVPLFFLISGYLFFIGFDPSKESYLAKIKSRTRTLFIPFLFWNIATLLITALAQAIPAAQVFFSGNNKPIASFGIFDYLSNIFGIGRDPIAYQFWFIRDLMLLVLFVPIFVFALKFVSWPFLSVLVLCWFLDFWPLFTPSVEATLFFYIGTYLASRKKSLFFLDQYFENINGVIILTFYVLITIVDALFFCESFSLCLHKVGVAVGVCSVLFLTKLVTKMPTLKRILLSLSGASFFVYAVHEPFLTVLRKLAFKFLMPDSSTVILVLYFLVPIVVIVTSVTAFRILSKLFPGVLSTVTGGRKST